ncbi:MAG: HI0074 family nucleotidyltransferase substrate-binding subunit [Alphaproteobacteria bacterium]|nr:MAG: hypothetical protein B6I23_03360 [Rickettsiaceae bacterium 4572_127]
MSRNQTENSKIYLENLKSAITKLAEILNEKETDIVRDATIQRFEFTIELTWKTMKRLLKTLEVEAISPREVMQFAYQRKWIQDESFWLNMLKDRNLVSHVYDEKTAKEIFNRIKNYLIKFQETYEKLENFLKNNT